MFYFLCPLRGLRTAEPYHYKSHPCSSQDWLQGRRTDHSSILILMYLKDEAALAMDSVHLVIFH